ncbi:MAG TPA: hypothetical protein VHH90_09320 [Polyangia bacterium]|nr:hypothetical protein [Polyangia bacterium]
MAKKASDREVCIPLGHWLTTMTRSVPLWESQAVAFFEKNPQKVFLRTEFARILTEQETEWGAPRSLTPSRLIKVLYRRGLREVDFVQERLPDSASGETPPKPTKTLTRLAWGDPNPYSLGASLRTGAYLSHASAVFLHGLTQEVPKTIYVNKEQSEKPSDPSSLTQEALDRAFQNKQRVSTYIFVHNDNRFVLLSGKHTNRLEVSNVEIEGGATVPATKLERTLIDITVRPLYAGGVFEVAKAFQAAKERVSVSTLVATLKKLEYVYPYHQAIGYYMERAGFSGRQLDRVRSLGLTYRFYLANSLHNPRLVPEWNLWVPDGL